MSWLHKVKLKWVKYQVQAPLWCCRDKTNSNIWQQMRTSRCRQAAACCSTKSKSCNDLQTQMLDKLQTCLLIKVASKTRQVTRIFAIFNLCGWFKIQNTFFLQQSVNAPWLSHCTMPTANKINAEAGQKYANVIKKKLDYTWLNYRDSKNNYNK